MEDKTCIPNEDESLGRSTTHFFWFIVKPSDMYHPIQQFDEVINIEGWSPDEPFSIYPEGSREKTLWVSPPQPSHSFLIGNHRYLFKHSSHRYPTQFWCEIIAYRIGCLMGIPVPPAYAAWIPGKNQSAAIIEWFYKQNDDVYYEPGTAHMKKTLPEFDIQKGSQHNIETLLQILENINKDLVLDILRIFVFDALIGNTDRHQDNWGLLWKGRPSQPTFAPAFDNGTSLGHEITEENLMNFIKNDNKIINYIEKGKHHIRWRLSESKNQCGHFDLIAWLLTKYPEYGKNLQSCLDVDLAPLNTWLATLPHFAIPVTLTTNRVAFIERLVQLRLERLRTVIYRRE
ncbi:MAG: hypothetical protein G8345_14810 [Magnetococcales bacterium]|nr:HipA domain-containing protein [Magnetococcales bacterium]NGZ28148.1 hypothetical protein [Magnetococcales bacterium]